MKTYFIIAAFVLPACGGTSFTMGLEGTGPDGGTELEAASGSGGSSATDDGGILPSSGGADVTEKDGSVSSGGASSSGGSLGTGGLVNTGGADSGGSPASGGTTSTGGTHSTGGAPGSGGALASTGGTTACTLVTHNNGTGQTWQDCVPLGTHNKEQALKACAAFVGPTGSCAANAAPACGTEPNVTGVTLSGLAIWEYTGEEDGYVGTYGGECPSPTARQPWG